jgi:hypothetical protein
MVASWGSKLLAVWRPRDNMVVWTRTRSMVRQMRGLQPDRRTRRLSPQTDRRMLVMVRLWYDLAKCASRTVNKFVNTIFRPVLASNLARRALR